MTSNQIEIEMDVREALSNHLTITVQMKGMWRVKVGMMLIRLAGWITGMQVVDEFPMSLIQPDQLRIVKKND